VFANDYCDVQSQARLRGLQCRAIAISRAVDCARPSQAISICSADRPAYRARKIVRSTLLTTLGDSAQCAKSIWWCGCAVRKDAMNGTAVECIRKPRLFGRAVNKLIARRASPIGSTICSSAALCLAWGCFAWCSAVVGRTECHQYDWEKTRDFPTR